MNTDNFAANPDPVDADSETPLHAAAWLVQDMGVAMPPVPHIYLDSIHEFVMGQVFGTSKAVADLKTRNALRDWLVAGQWPSPGLAFGFVAVGTGGIWFYTLVGEQSILQISLRVSFYSQAATASGQAGISAAHRLLEKYLGNEANYLRAINPMPPMQGAPRRVVSYSNESGFPQEAVATWQHANGLSEFSPQNQVFSFSPPPFMAGGEHVQFRA